MLEKKHRLRKDKDIKLAYKKGRFVNFDWLTLKVAHNDLNVTRFGFMVGIKVSKKAVVRNRVRRQISEVIRLVMPKIASGYDVLVIVKPSVVGKDYKDIEEVALGALKRSKLLKT